jgi:hypothetical protein
MGLNHYLQDLTEHAINSQKVHVDLYYFLMPAASVCPAEKVKVSCKQVHPPALMAEDRDKGGGKAKADPAGAQGVPHELGPANKSPKGRGWDLGRRSRRADSK